MRRRTIAATLVAASAAAAVTVPALAATKSVTVGDNYFVRKSGVPTVSVQRNDTVRWVFRGERKHNVVVTRGPQRFSSPVKERGTYRKRVTRRGTYRIVCTIHGASDQSMVLRVR